MNRRSEGRRLFLGFPLALRSRLRVQKRQQAAAVQVHDDFSQRLKFGVRAQKLEKLPDVDAGAVVAVALVAEDGAQRFAGGDGLDQLVRQTGVETRGEGIAIDEEHPFPINVFFSDRQRKIHTPIDQHLE